MKDDGSNGARNFDLFNNAVDHWMGRLKRAEFALLCVYLRHAGPDGRAWPGNDMLAKKMGRTDVRQVRRMRNRLIKMGLLVSEGTNARYGTEIYRVHIKNTPSNIGGIEHPGVSNTPGGKECPEGEGTGYPKTGGKQYPSNSTDNSSVEQKESEDKPLAAAKKEKKPAKSTRKPSDKLHPQAIAYFVQWWEGRYEGKYSFAGGKDGKHVAAILAALDGDTAKYRATVDAYFADTDQFYVRSRHPLGTLLSQLNRFTPAKKAVESDGWVRAPVTDEIRRIVTAPLQPGENGFEEQEQKREELEMEAAS